MQAKRSMTFNIEGQVIYDSTFDPNSGTLTRILTTPTNEQDYISGIEWLFVGDADWHKKDSKWRTKTAKWREKYGYRSFVFSPSPESIDISITNWCNFGCPYCYQSSLPTETHAPKDLAVKVIDSFDIPPYQMAIGGGEPTAHPDFPEILASIREKGVVPNYTTAGHIWRPEVIDATNSFCGGISLTYHRFKGIDHFKDTYQKWKNEITTPLNIHVIADKDVALSLEELRNALPGQLSIILLAYYPDVGRGTHDRIMTKKIYEQDLPYQLKTMLDKEHQIAFSEGLLPYFFSRPEIGISTDYAMRSEGYFSYYVDSKGRLSDSSFDPPRDKTRSVLYGARLQEEWNTLNKWRGCDGAECSDCEFRYRCATPNDHHYLACDFADHNKKFKKQGPMDWANYWNKIQERDRSPKAQTTIVINTGFITNSSSVIHYFDKRILNHPKVKAILEAYEVSNGYVGCDLWSRIRCGSLVISPDQHKEVNEQLNQHEYGPAGYNSDQNTVSVIYGDEYTTLSSIISDVMVEASKELKMPVSGTEYN